MTIGRGLDLIGAVAEDATNARWNFVSGDRWRGVSRLAPLRSAVAGRARSRCVDNVFTGTRRNVEHLLGHRRFDLVRHDVTFPPYVETDEIYNLAAPASPIHYQSHPSQTTKTIVHGAFNMLGLAKRLRARVLQASTSEVDGDPEVHPQTEAYWGRVNPIGIRSCYDEARRCAETLFFHYWRESRVAIKVARIFNTTTRECIRTTGVSSATSSSGP